MMRVEVSNIEGVVKLRIGNMITYLWDSASIIALIDVLRNNKIKILGGDVYTFNQYEIKLTYESWTTNKNSLYEDSFTETVDYIRNYEKKHSGKYLYGVVIEGLLGDDVVLY